MTSTSSSESRRSFGVTGFAALVLGVACVVGVGAYFWIVRTASLVEQTGRTEIENPDYPNSSSEGRAEEDRAPWLEDVTGTSGVKFSTRNGEEANQFTILESLGSGVALIDYDGDGLLDLFLVGGGFFDGPKKDQIRGAPCKLFRNLGHLQFKDVSQEAGFEIPWWYTHGTAVADFDLDGWPDLFVTGYGRVALFHNKSDSKGGRTFVDVSAKLGLLDSSWCTGAGWGDFDGDGYPDLYVCHYTDWSFENHPFCAGQVPGIPRDICPPHRFNPQVHSLFRNERGTKFVEVPGNVFPKLSGYGLGVVLADLNSDGRPDAYVSNDMSRNFLCWNRGGRFEENAVEAGASLDDTGRATASMGVDVGDFDGSSRPSVFVTNFQRELHSLFQNVGKESFYYQSQAVGLAAISRVYVGWGTGFIDVDNDGWEDLALVNGHLFRHPAGSPIKQPRIMLQNVEKGGRRVFEDRSARAGRSFRIPGSGRGLAIGDLDNDGWPDLVVTNLNAPTIVFRNLGGTAQVPNHWIGIRLRGKGRRDTVGSTITLKTDSRQLTRFSKGGGSYLSAHDSRILFGLGSASTPRRVTVRWSWGGEQSWDDLLPGHYYELTEEDPQSRRVQKPNP